MHALTAGAMGTMILAVMTRATLGHTGRVLRADKATMAIYALVSASALLRIVAAWVVDGQMDTVRGRRAGMGRRLRTVPRRVRPDAVGARGDDAAILHRQQGCMRMKAVVCEAFGGPEVLALRDVPDPPPPGPGEVQVRIEARGVQYVDVLMLAGKYQFRPEPPFIPGGEAAGVVIAVGPGVTQFRVGDQVMSRHSLGACAELGNAKAALCDHVPAGMSLEAAGVFRGAYSTAYHALLQRGRMKAGEWVLVHGAAGGIGIAAIQVAKLFGAKVIATASTEEKRAPAWRKAPIMRSTTRAGSSTR